MNLNKDNIKAVFLAYVGEDEKTAAELICSLNRRELVDMIVNKYQYTEADEISDSTDSFVFEEFTVTVLAGEFSAE